MEPDFREWLNQTVTIEHPIGKDGAADTIYGPPVSYAARVVKKTKMVRDKKGREVVSNAQIYLDGMVPVKTNDRLTLPEGEKPPIISIDEPADEAGSIHHKVVYT